VALATFFAKHGAILLGLVVGTAAKFGRMMALDQKFTLRQVLGHCLMMGAVGVAATVIVDLAGITDPNFRAFTAAVLAIAASDVVKYLATRAWRKFLADVADNPGELRQSVQRVRSARRLAQDLSQSEE